MARAQASFLVLAALCAAPAVAVGLRTAKPGDHLVHEAIDQAEHPNGTAPLLPHEKDFLALDRNGDKQLDAQELMLRQYASGCDGIEAQIRSEDYLRCGDTDKNGLISPAEFEAAMQPAWAECVRSSADRRAHTFYRFFEADKNFDGKLDETELRVEVYRMWGSPGEELVEPLLVCTDSNKDLLIDQREFHRSLAVYNPAARTWQLMYHDGDQQALDCLAAAMARFDTRLVFTATDSNKDGRVSKQESYDALLYIDPTIMHTTADDLFDKADSDKDGFLTLEEFAMLGGGDAPAFLAHRLKAAAPLAASVSAAAGMGAACAARPVPSYSLWAPTNRTQ